MNLRIDWATYEATKFACQNWHYSGTVPAGKIVKIGAWEDGKFIGVVLFSLGASPHIGSPYGLKMENICELTRVAMCKHKVEITKIIKIALTFLRRKCPKTKIVVSYADIDQGHKGGIYKGGNWIYEGTTGIGFISSILVNGKKTHNKTINEQKKRDERRNPSIKGMSRSAWLRQYVDPNAKEIKSEGKHKFLMPLDKKWWTEFTRSKHR